MIFLNCSYHELTSSFIDLVYSYGYIPLITRPTRLTEKTATLIDNILTNDLQLPGQNNLNGILLTDVSDHLPIFHLHNTPAAHKIATDKKVRIFNEKNRHIFIRSISEVNWHAVFSSPDVQSAYTIFFEKLCTIFNESFPKKTLRTKYNNRKPWLTKILQEAIKKKNMLYFRKLKCPSDHNIMFYRAYRNKLNHILM